MNTARWMSLCIGAILAAAAVVWWLQPWTEWYHPALFAFMCLDGIALVATLPRRRTAPAPIPVRCAACGTEHAITHCCLRPLCAACCMAHMAAAHNFSAPRPCFGRLKECGAVTHSEYVDGDCADCRPKGGGA